nr:uncharacterized protein LOC109169177 [Ipomoea batatas]
MVHCQRAPPCVSASKTEKSSLCRRSRNTATPTAAAERRYSPTGARSREREKPGLPSMELLVNVALPDTQAVAAGVTRWKATGGISKNVYAAPSSSLCHTHRETPPAASLPHRPRPTMPPRRNQRAATPPPAGYHSPVEVHTPPPHTAPRRDSPRSSSSSPVKHSSRRSDSDDLVEHFDESVGDSVVVHNTSHRVFRAFSFIFYCSSLNFLLETFSARNFIHQRRLDVNSFSSRTDLVETLKTTKLFKTVTKVINAYYGLPGYADYFDKDLNEITKRLTGGHAPYWISKDSIKESELTSFFAFLHKIAFSNWMPSTNHRYVTKKMAALLFKIDTGVNFDLGQLLFDHIVDAQNGKAGKKDLVLPNLIYGLLAMQGFQKHSSEYFEAHLVPIKFNQRLLSGSHFDDLGLSRDAVAAGPSSSANCGTLAIEFLENELCLISAQRKNLVDRELQVWTLLLKLKGFGTLGSVNRSPINKVVASESASSSSD